ncbi:MAG: hypothetical protein KIT87_16080 [Anaerolineae bacterium]|nr:hypothetical protein [Anaerolineae bacterium]
MPVRLVRLLLVSLVMGMALVLGWLRQSQPDMEGHSLHLAPPAFLETAYAQASGVAAQLDQEAGISAYVRIANGITLSRVRGQFRTTELDTSDYILGSVAVPGYPEHYDVHVYVHRTGWMLAYYPQGVPVSKIVDVVGQTLSPTKLEKVLGLLADAAGVALPSVTYYHFEYPNATHMMLVGEDEANGNDFTIQLPSSYSYFEQSWAARRIWNNFYGVLTGWFSLDGATNPNTVYDERNTGIYGRINPSQMPTETTHTITVQNYGVLVIVYRMP